MKPGSHSSLQLATIKTKKIKESVIIALVCIACSVLTSQTIRTISETKSGTCQGICSEQNADDPRDGGPKIGQMTPDFRLPDMEGNRHSLSDFRGKAMVLGFFCGCDRCYAAARKIAAEQKAGKLKNFIAVVALDPQGTMDFRKSTGPKAVFLLDPSDQTAETYASDFCPRLWQIRAVGIVAYRSEPALEYAELDKSLSYLAGL